DHVRHGHFAANLGLRVDRHRMLIRETALSPRAAASYWLPGPKLLLRASYDRVFQPPPLENLLLSSAATTFDLDDIEGALPVPASKGNFYELGVRHAFSDKFRIDVRHYWRRFRNFADDDVFLNTGISFPITFKSASIRGTEVRLDVPRWKAASGWISYANMRGTATSPVTGGLFIEGSEAEELRLDVVTFPVSQDQRHTLAAQTRVQFGARLWLLGGLNFGSGLPVELQEDADLDAVPEAILRRVDLKRERLDPNLSVNAGAGWQMHPSASLQISVRNLTDRLNVINFSGLFSATALAPRRQVFIQLNVRL
ncbi:MAG TPA: TonB-dependent receptor, partial [Bryobacteraceae bacterium]|nr:TonB-dependent receptor [Bryobacteraceae bacterium]